MKGTSITVQSNLRFGYISDYDATRHMGRVIFPDLDGLISGWLPVGVPNSLSNQDELHLDIDEHVAVLMMGNGSEQGIILCSIYDDTNKPVAGETSKRRIRFSDGTELEYDREEHKLTGKVQGEVELEASGDMKLRGKEIRIEASGSLYLWGNQVYLH